MLETFPKPDNSFSVKPKNGTSPFENLKESSIKGRTSKFYDIPNREDVIVRKSYAKPPAEFAKFNSEPDIEGLAKYWSIQAEILNKICQKYRIRIAKTSYILEHDPEKEKTFSDEGISLIMITERINGKNLAELTDIDEEAYRKIDHFYSSVLLHIYDSYTEESGYWGDCKNSQIVYGTAPHENEKDLFIVDTDPEIKPWLDEFIDDADVAGLKKIRHFWWYLLFVVSEIEKLEESVSKKFEGARSTLKEVLTKIPKPDDVHAIRRYEKINNFLEK